MDEKPIPQYVLRESILSLIILWAFATTIAFKIIIECIDKWYLVLLVVTGLVIVLYLLYAHYMRRLEFYSDYIQIVRPLYRQIIKLNYSEIINASILIGPDQNEITITYIVIPNVRIEMTFPFKPKSDQEVIEILKEHGIECKGL